MAKKIKTLNDVRIEKMRLEKKAEKIEKEINVEFKNIVDNIRPVSTVFNVLKNKPSASSLIPTLVYGLVKRKGSIWGTAATIVAEYIMANVDTEKAAEKIIKIITRRKKREKKEHTESSD